ncbi:MAG: DUF6064 family protein [Burkholderiales bacterium]
MPEWWTYTPGDFLMYSPRVHGRLLAAYQRDLWPAQVVALALAVALALSVRSRVAWRGRAASAVLAAGWAWVAWGFFAQRYATIDWAGTYFAWAFAAQALLLAVLGAGRDRLLPDVGGSGVARGAYALLLFALFVQPALGVAFAGSWQSTPLAGVLPDPTAVATLGFVLMAQGRVRWTLLVIPLLWCAASGTLAWAMESAEAFVMFGAAALALVLAVVQRRDRGLP